MSSKETKKEILKEARELAKEIYGVDGEQIRDMEKMEKVYKKVEELHDNKLSDILYSIMDYLGTLAKVNEPPKHNLETDLYNLTNLHYDPETLWLADSIGWEAETRYDFAGADVLDVLEEIKKFIGKNPEQTVLYADPENDALYLVEERPITKAEASMLRDQVRNLHEKRRSQEAKEERERAQEQHVNNLLKVAEEVGVEKAINILRNMLDE